MQFNKGINSNASFYQPASSSSERNTPRFPTEQNPTADLIDQPEGDAVRMNMTKDSTTKNKLTKMFGNTTESRLSNRIGGQEQIGIRGDAIKPSAREDESMVFSNEKFRDQLNVLLSQLRQQGKKTNALTKPLDNGMHHLVSFNRTMTIAKQLGLHVGVKAISGHEDEQKLTAALEKHFKIQNYDKHQDPNVEMKAMLKGIFHSAEEALGENFYNKLNRTKSEAECYFIAIANPTSTEDLIKMLKSLGMELTIGSPAAQNKPSQDNKPIQDKPEQIKVQGNVVKSSPQVQNQSTDLVARIPLRSHNTGQVSFDLPDEQDELSNESEANGSEADDSEVLHHFKAPPLKLIFLLEDYDVEQRKFFLQTLFPDSKINRKPFNSFVTKKLPSAGMELLNLLATKRESELWAAQDATFHKFRNPPISEKNSTQPFAPPKKRGRQAEEQKHEEEKHGAQRVSSKYQKRRDIKIERKSGRHVT